MAISVTKLRANLYQIVDRLIETGVPVEIERKGERVRLEAAKPKSKLRNLTGNPGTIVGDPEDIVHVDWSAEWSEGRRS
jgi:antitoxin (DNA-binding transcriptional repressor) of toxin-antitoxin stability system